MMLATLSCDRQEAVVEYIAPKDEPFQVAPAERPGPPARSVAGPEAIHWTLPAGWSRQSESRQFRFATLGAGTGKRRLEVSISRLAGDGGGLLANINRWRVEQMGLEKIRAEQLADHTARLDVKDSEAFLVDIESKQADSNRRMLVAVIFRSGVTWFFKAAADSDVVGEHHAGFLKLLSSVHFVAASPGPPPPSAVPQIAAAEATWTVPRGFRAAEGGEQVTVTVSRLGGDGGGLLANINRWRVQQMGLEPVVRPDDQPQVALKIDGTDGRMVDMGDRTGPDKRMLVAMVRHGGVTWFFKMTGPGNVVEQQRRGFDEFLESVAFEQAR
jgi:hypothetical protein